MFTKWILLWGYSISAELGAAIGMSCTLHSKIASHLGNTLDLVGKEEGEGGEDDVMSW